MLHPTALRCKFLDNHAPISEHFVCHTAWILQYKLTQRTAMATLITVAGDQARPPIPSTYPDYLIHITQKFVLKSFKIKKEHNNTNIYLIKNTTYF